MARSVSLTTLRARVRRAGDWEYATDRVTNTELDDAINEGIAAMWDEITKTTGHWKRSESSPANTAAGQQAYALGATVYQLLSVKMTINGRESSLTSIDEITQPEATSIYATTGAPQFYTLAGDYILFSPTPDSAYSFKYAFVPTPTVLTTGTDVLDGINGWERYPVYYAVKEIAGKQKEWELFDRADNEMSKVAARIAEMGKRRDPLPATIVDVEGISRRNAQWNWNRR